MGERFQPMKRVAGSYHTERSGVLAVAKIVYDELRWVFREQEQDFGIDAHIEVVADYVATGKLIAVQIKSGKSYFAEEDSAGIVFRGKPEHLDYWLKHDLPVIVILYEPETGNAFWQSVTTETITRTIEGWKMSIPREQKFGVAQTSRLEELAFKLQQIKEELQEYKCPYCAAPLGDRGGEWVGSEHFGIREVFQCGYDNTDGFVNHPCPSDPKFPTFSDYELEFHPIPSDPENPWFCIANPKTDMARTLHLHASGRTKEEAEQKVRAGYERNASKYKS
jgi:Domain of unknown function (DUF4365)